MKYSSSKHRQKPSMSLGQEVPLLPWSKFHFEGTSYLLIVDYTSRYLVVCKSSSMTGQHVANQCKLTYSEYGWLETLISDNGSCYTSETFASLMKDYSVNHITSSPHYPQSNGLAEKFAQIVKSLFHKAKEECKDLFKCLMIYHNTPLSSSLKSPNQILQSRSTRSEHSMLNAVRKQIGLDSEELRSAYTMNICLHMTTMLAKMLCSKM